MPRTYTDRTKLQVQAAAIANVQRASARYLAAFGLAEDQALELVLSDELDGVFETLDRAANTALMAKRQAEGQLTLDEQLEEPGILEHVEGLATIDDVMAILEAGREAGKHE